ncbi:MAG: response regulator [Phycisphaerae bacterium]
MKGKVSILLVDDHALVRDTLADRLQRELDFVIVGIASTAEEAIALAARTQPDIVLSDIDMPGLNSFEAAKKLLDRLPNLKIIFLSAFVHDVYVEQALSVEAHGYLTKREPPDTVVMAIREVVSGGAYFSEEVQSRIMVDEKGVNLRSKSKSLVSTLSPRELEVLQYIAQGLGKKDIAKLTNLSVKTVDHHTSRLMNRLKIHDRVDLARFALREGLIQA